MSDPVLIALIAAGPGIVSSFLSYLTNRRVKVAVTHLGETKDAIVKLEKNTNDKMDKLLSAKDELRESTNTVARAEGKAEGLAECKP